MNTAKIAHRISETDLEAAPDFVEAGFKEGDLVQITVDDGVPSFTLRADSDFGIRSMMRVRDLAVSSGRVEAKEIQRTLRRFDLFEEENRV